MNTLVVEDEFAARMKLKYFLEKYGECEAVENGDDAISVFKEAHSQSKPFDLICLDIKMPGKSGHETLDEIRRLEEEIELPFEMRVKVFMTTALVDAKTISKAFYELCDEYITKPVKQDALLELLQKHNLVS